MKLITMCRGLNLKIVEFLTCFSKKLKYIYRTEFWRILQINLWNWSKMKPIYTNPDSDYQKFINACRFKNVATLCNKKVVEKANKLWKEMKLDKKQVCASFDYSSTRIKTKQGQTMLPSSKSNSITGIVFLFTLHLPAALYS